MPTDPFLAPWECRSTSGMQPFQPRTGRSGTHHSSTERRTPSENCLESIPEGAEILLAKRPTVPRRDPCDHRSVGQVVHGHSCWESRFLLAALSGLSAQCSGMARDQRDLSRSCYFRRESRLTDPTRAGRLSVQGPRRRLCPERQDGELHGVAAKAIDAGYRLVIVMTGTIEMLRAQTQRRIDMEMVGRQNILGDLSRTGGRVQGRLPRRCCMASREFIDLGEAELATEIRRLTHHRKDYQKQFRTLKIDRFEMGRPLYDPQNLFRSAARVAIVKKNATVLRKLVTDIRRIRTPSPRSRSY